MIITLFLFLFSLLPNQQTFSKTAYLMGVDFEFTVVADNEEQGEYYLGKAIEETQRVENLISSWKADSQTSLINQNAGVKPVKVDKELFDLIKRSKRISDLTDGAFDISFSSIDKVWNFNEPMTSLPSDEEITASVAKINYKNIILNEEQQTVFLKEKGMKIGFGAIGKGYVAEKVKAELQKMGVKAGLINASGDITTWGANPKHDQWNIAISHPILSKENFGWFKLKDNAVVTSGNYEKYVIINGKKYAHIINPKTGWPTDELSSVTIFTSNAELADALATSVFVMGIENGLDFINQLNGVDALLIDLNGNYYASENISKKLKHE